MHIKDFDGWLKYKKNLQNRAGPDFSRRQIWWTAIGVNLGDETDGKNYYFERPVLILKKMNQNLFLGIPMTSTEIEGNHFIKYDFVEGSKFLMLHQVRVFSRKRLLRKIHRMGEKKFSEVQEMFKGIFKKVTFKQNSDDNSLAQIEMPSFDDISRTTFVEDIRSIAGSQNLSIPVLGAEEGKIEKEYKFVDFMQAMGFVNKVAKVAEEMQHHPEIEINYNAVEIETTTHDAGNVVTEKDMDLMKQIDEIYQNYKN